MFRNASRSLARGGLNGGQFDPNPESLRILCLTQGRWGERIATNIKHHAPSDWTVEIRSLPRVLPPIIDDPEDFLPPDLPKNDLLLSLGEIGGLAQLVPDAAKATGTKAVIAPIDRNVSLPPGLAGQLRDWLEDMGVTVVFPKPFCSLTEQSIHHGRLKAPYEDPLIRRFAVQFGKPELTLTIDEGRITEAEVVRDSACGCARYVAENLIGVEVNEAVEEAGMLHHHFPCLASMNQDADYLDTLMHVSGNILKDTIREEIEAHLSIVYLRPHGYSDHEGG